MSMVLTPLRTSSKKLTRLIASRTPTFTQHAAHQANQTRTLICDGFWKEGITRNDSRLLHHSCASLLHWRGLRSVAKRRYGALKKSAVRPWLPEEEQVGERGRYHGPVHQRVDHPRLGGTQAALECGLHPVAAPLEPRRRQPHLRHWTDCQVPQGAPCSRQPLLPEAVQ